MHSSCLSDFTLSLLSPTGIHEEQNHDLDQPRSDLFLFPDESGNLPQELSPTYPTLHSPLITPAPSLVPETDDFCILETPGSRADVRTCISYTYLLSMLNNLYIFSVTPLHWCDGCVCLRIGTRSPW